MLLHIEWYHVSLLLHYYFTTYYVDFVCFQTRLASYIRGRAASGAKGFRELAAQIKVES